MPVDSNTDPASSHAPVTDASHMLPAHASADSSATKGSLTRKLITLAVLLLIIGLIVWRVMSNKAETASTSDKAAAAANRATPVLTAPVLQKTVPVYLTALGTVTAYNSVTLHSRVDGQLMQVNFREGETVRQGQLLLQIDPRPYKAAVDQAQGTLAKDEANLKNVEAEAQRYTQLYQAGVVSKEQQQAQISNAGQAAGSIKADQAAIEAAKVNLGYTSIYSPINGVVGLRQVDPGNIVHASDSTGLIVINQIHPIAVVFTLPEDQLPDVQKAMHGGAKLTVEAYGRSDQHMIASGTLITIDNQIDTTTGTAKLKAVFDNADGALFPNQFVNVRLILEQLQNAIVVPTAAIQTGTNGNFVYVVHPGPTPANKRQAGAGAGGGSGSHKHSGTDGSAAATNGTAAPETASAGSDSSGAKSGGGAGGRSGGPVSHVDSVPVTINFAQGSNTVLQPSALKPGDQVVIDGQEKLTDGSNVQPAQGNPATAPVSNAIGGGTADPAATTGNASGGRASGQADASQAGAQGQSHGGGHSGAGGNGGGSRQ